MLGDLATIVRRRLLVRGQVQGVGFRPYVYRLAAEAGLRGFVANNRSGAVLEVEGSRTAVDDFERSLVRCLPPLARVDGIEHTSLPTRGESQFRIETSCKSADDRPDVTPDAATCCDCLNELFDPGDRRWRYAFINCTNCGPRYSIICEAPYDRPATTMAEFAMCPVCLREYGDPTNRRFHAQPNACPVCGPRLALWRKTTADDGGGITSRREGYQLVKGDAVRIAGRILADDGIVAIKGIGGYHLACRADREAAVARLREGKLRDGKPLAVMVPDLAAARRICWLTETDEQTLRSAAAPIVLVPQRDDASVAPSVAPRTSDFGVMLPYAPMHHLLFGEGLGPLVMTSGNLAGRPLEYEDDAAFAALGDVADAFLIHNRRIFRPIDDSVAVTFRGGLVPIRRARGYAPQALRLSLPGADAGGRRILAVGGELKATACLLVRGQAILSEHLGDLTHPDTYRNYVRAVERLKGLNAFDPEIVAHDLHPQYLSTRYALGLGIAAVAVQHHHAHIASVMAEHNEPGPIIGLVCDGTGYGTDGAVWGCELLLCNRGGFERLGHLEYFPLVGGDLAAVETWRPAVALLRRAFDTSWREALRACVPAGQSSESPRVFDTQATRGVNTPPTSSLGRLFDGVSYLLGLCHRNRHEAEAAMALEEAAGRKAAEPFAYEVGMVRGGRIRMSMDAAVREVVLGRRRGERVGRLAGRFHETVVCMLADAAVRACRQRGVTSVALSGGCFANRRLLGGIVDRLERESLRVLYHGKVPCGDGGLSLGQAVVAAWKLSLESERLEPRTECVECV